jgi:uncharacterized protein YjaG (DUF416 family)
MNLGLELHKDELDQLPAGAKMILAAACTQRHSVNYHTFAGGTGSRRSKQFDAILDAIWRDIGYDQLSTDQLEKLRFRAEQLVPEEGHPGPRPYDGYGQFAAEALIICCVAARLHGDSTHVVYIAKRAFESIRAFLRKTCSTWRLPDGRLRPDVEVMFAAHPLTLDEGRRQERDLNDVKRMLRERCSIIDIVENLERRSKAEALFPIGSGTMP